MKKIPTEKIRFKKDETCKNCIHFVRNELRGSFTFYSCKEHDSVVVPYDQCLLFEKKNETQKKPTS